MENGPVGTADGSSLDPSLLPPIVDPQARLSYVGSSPLTSPPSAPLPLLREWYSDAVTDSRISEPNAMVVATADGAGRPNARTVLLKGLDARGFTFFTNLGSTKGSEIAANPFAALVLLWHPMFRQVRVRGVVEPVEDAEAADYFAGRPRDSQVSAWASRQSQPAGSRGDVEQAFVLAQQRWAGQDVVPKPPFWGGYRVLPVEVELWVGQASRLHDRVAYRTPDEAPRLLDDPVGWTTTRLQP